MKILRKVFRGYFFDPAGRCDMMRFPKMRQKQWPIARTISLVARKQDVGATVHRMLYSVFQKSDAKIEITITATNLNYHLSSANIANFNKIHCTVFEQHLFKKWNSKTEVSNMEKSPYQFVRNTISYSLCSKWSPFAQTFACLLCRPYVLCCCSTSCLQTL